MTATPAAAPTGSDPHGGGTTGDGAGRVVVLGSLNADVFARVAHRPAPGETVLGHGGESRPGGKGANQGVAAALAGAPVVMIGAVGDDAHARTALRGLQEAGADTHAIRVVDVPTGLALITVSADGENTIIVIPGANDQVGGPELDALQGTLTAADVLVLQGEIRPEVATAAARSAADVGARVVINLAPVVAYPPDVLRRADVLVVNEHEALGALEILQAGTAPTDPPPVPADGPTAPADAVARLVDEGVRAVVMTLGGDGVLIADGAASSGAPAPEPEHLPARPVPVVDTTGAGDAFVGALAARLLRADSLADAAALANRFAAEAVQHEGAQDSYPDWRCG